MAHKTISRAKKRFSSAGRKDGEVENDQPEENNKFEYHRL